MGETTQNLGQQSQGFLFDLGKQQQAQQQAELEAQRQSEMSQLYEPYQRLSFLSDIYKGAPSTQQTISAGTSPSVSPAQTILGLGIGGLSAFAGAKEAVILMMNRSLMQRQMFAKGGAAGFPDLTGDGQVTQADILKGRGVQLAMGGEPMAAQQAAMMQDPSMDQGIAQAQSVGLDPSVVESMLSQVSEGFDDLDNAESFEEVINSMRGDQAPLTERYAELGEIVGQEDARATPESVLALVQPVIQLASVDQGIGGLAQEQMTTPVEGNMAGGIMSTVDMGEEVPAL